MAALRGRLLLRDEAATERVASAAGSTVLLSSQPGADSVLFSGRAVAHLDRPLAADGGRLRLPAAWLGSRPSRDCGSTGAAAALHRTSRGSLRPSP